jgi:hypothetical protein
LASCYAGGTSGYAALRRTLAAGEEDTWKGKKSFSDLVRKPQNFKLWQAVRASTAAPTFFPSEWQEVSCVSPVHVYSHDAKQSRDLCGVDAKVAIYGIMARSCGGGDAGPGCAEAHDAADRWYAVQRAGSSS